MNVFIIPALFPNSLDTYSGIFIKEQCDALAKDGCNLIVLDASALGFRHWHKRSYFKTNQYQKEGYTVIVNHYRGLALSTLPIISFINYYRRLKKIFNIAIKKYGKPDIIHAHFTFLAGFASVLLSKELKIPVIVTEHNSLFLRDKLSNTIKKMLQITINESNKFVCVSNLLAIAVTKNLKTKSQIIVIPNMINEIFKYDNKEQNEEFLFFSAGNLNKGKRMDVLIKAFINAFSSNDKVKLKIAGEGVEFKNLMDIIQCNNRTNQIILLGKLDREEMNEKYKECSVFILVSAYETFGVVYREAMAVGRPVIATKNGGIEENWNDAVGKLVEVDNEKEIVNAMKYLHENIKSYDNYAISKFVKENYSSNFITKKVLEIYREVVKND